MMGRAWASGSADDNRCGCDWSARHVAVYCGACIAPSSSTITIIGAGRRSASGSSAVARTVWTSPTRFCASVRRSPDRPRRASQPSSAARRARPARLQRASGTPC
ncbi:MAG: hypothetical protein RMK84_20045 [Oscillochloridaceae bacterium]|nr:hypothetical protein [Oscillochloridaceae bacterium]